MAKDWLQLADENERKPVPPNLRKKQRHCPTSDPSDLVLVEYHAPVQRGSNGR